MTKDVSYTAVANHTTAAQIGKEYSHEFPPSTNPNKSSARTDDGTVTSADVARLIPGSNTLGGDGVTIDYSHPLEKYLPLKPMRWLLGVLSKVDAGQTTALERIITSYRNPDAPWQQKIKYALLHMFIDRMRRGVDVQTFRSKLADNAATVRGLVVVARSIAEFGLTVPQKFTSPLFAVWNITNQCNLKCNHCYQDSDRNTLASELSLEEKLDLVDQMGKAHMPMLAFSGGEPTVCPDLLAVVARAKKWGMHQTMATNGTMLTPEFAANLRQAGMRYVEVSLDSIDPAKHDEFRGAVGLWKKSVQGAKNVVATEGLRLGIAMCVHQGNLHEVSDMIDFAEDIGADCFAHFNFIPVGRGLEMVSGDITPAQREQLLSLLNKRMQAGGIGIISTAPQLGRHCLAGAISDDEKVSCSHAGSGSGAKARVVAKYLGGCGAGRTYVCVEPDGKITPCVYMPHRVMGSIRQKPLIDIFRDSVFWEILNDRDRRQGHCEVCTFKNYCGGCRARADAYFGDLHGPDPGCVFNDKHWQKLVDSGVVQ